MRRSVTRIATLTALTTATAALAAGPAFAQDAEVPEPDSFTSMFTAMAGPDTVVGPDGPAPGEAEGTDTGEGFSLKEIEAEPAAFFADTHTSAFTAGAVRGQLTRVPMGGVDTGAGGAAGDTGQPLLGAALLAVAGTAVAGTAIARRRARG